MSIYSKKDEGWRYDFMVKGVRYTHAWFKTKAKARQAEAERRREVLNPTESPTATDMEFSELVNRRLDHLKAYNSQAHYDDYRYRCGLGSGCLPGLVMLSTILRFAISGLERQSEGESMSCC